MITQSQVTGWLTASHALLVLFSVGGLHSCPKGITVALEHDCLAAPSTQCTALCTRLTTFYEVSDSTH